MDKDSTFEATRIAAIEGSVLVFDAPLRFSHGAGEIVSAEFVRYRWYPDVQFGTAYFHDHVNAISSWKHGLFGALIVEPPGSSYHDPFTGTEVASGPIADIRTDEPVSLDVNGSFRELVLFVQDDNPVAHLGRSTGSSFNLRAEPLGDREGDPSRVFGSALYGDPETPILRARLGDPVVFRTLVGGTNDVHTLHVDGHWFRAEGYSGTSPPISTIGVGISERQDLVIPAAGGPQRMPGDYLYYNGRSFKLAEGSWGIFRVLASNDASNLQRLPGRGPVDAEESVCPAGAIARTFEIAAISARLPMFGRGSGKLYVLERDRQAVLEGKQPPQPLVLHINVGDCVTVELTNRTADGPVTFHADMLAADPRESAGVEAGENPRQEVAPGETRTYTYYAHPDVGETVALVRDWGDVANNPSAGLYGAFVVGPAGTTYRDPTTGKDLDGRASWQAIVDAPGRSPHRDFTLFFQDEDEAIGNHRMPYATRVDGVVGLNYRSMPLEGRSRSDGAEAPLYRADRKGGGGTPLIEAVAGDPVTIHVLSPSSEQSQVFSLEGHEWSIEPGRDGANVVSSQRFGGLEAFTLSFEAGGPERLAGDYLYGDHREPFREAGLWGIFRVHDRGERASVRPLTDAHGNARPWRWIAAASAVAVIFAVLGLGLSRSRRAIM
jgi:FtsP/CotA-like multicopper oxidase with cupredoxin domain